MKNVAATRGQSVRRTNFFRLEGFSRRETAEGGWSC